MFSSVCLLWRNWMQTLQNTSGNTAQNNEVDGSAYQQVFPTRSATTVHRYAFNLPQYFIIYRETGLQYSTDCEAYVFYKTAEIGLFENVAQIRFKKIFAVQNDSDKIILTFMRHIDHFRRKNKFQIVFSRPLDSTLFDTNNILRKL